MSNIERSGMGVLIGMLGGNKGTVESIRDAIGRKISSACLMEGKEKASCGGQGDSLTINFDDGSQLKIWDAGQSCCEARYMRTDDPIHEHVGEIFTGAKIKEGPTEIGEYGEPHEIQFLEIQTNKGFFTVTTHNEHNGYYGGFWIEAEFKESGND